MRHTRALALAGTIAIASGAGVFAAQTKPVATGTKAVVGSHATRGVVTAIDATTLVIARPGKQGAMTFEVSAATAKDGMPAVGSPVSIRYREEGSKHVATAITVQHAKKGAQHKPASRTNATPRRGSNPAEAGAAYRACDTAYHAATLS